MPPVSSNSFTEGGVGSLWNAALMYLKSNIFLFFSCLYFLLSVLSSIPRTLTLPDLCINYVSYCCDETTEEKPKKGRVGPAGQGVWSMSAEGMVTAS